jgi:NAD(P)-dependent dehydrogenase (short-subunit alcohol dehydrogenase family)
MAKRWTTKDMPDMTGRVAIVTGANAGLGFEITQALAWAGCTVVMACRNEAKADAAAEAIRATGARGAVEIAPVDLAELAAVRSAAAHFLASGRALDLLVNNAGLMAIDESTTADGFETQFGVNHLGHFALTAELLPALFTAPASRVVTMSSMGHRMGRMSFDDLMHRRRYDRWTPYFQSKLANLLFTAELQRRLAAHHAPTIALAAHPGASNTDLGVEGHGWTNSAMKIVPHVAQPAANGAEPALRAATDPHARGGELYGPRWMARGHAVVERPGRRARSSADAARLWQMSEELIGRAVLPIGG